MVKNYTIITVLTVISLANGFINAMETPRQDPNAGWTWPSYEQRRMRHLFLPNPKQRVGLEKQAEILNAAQKAAIEQFEYDQDIAWGLSAAKTGNFDPKKYAKFGLDNAQKIATDLNKEYNQLNNQLLHPTEAPIIRTSPSLWNRFTNTISQKWYQWTTSYDTQMSDLSHQASVLRAANRAADKKFQELRKPAEYGGGYVDQQKYQDLGLPEAQKTLAKIRNKTWKTEERLRDLRSKWRKNWGEVEKDEASALQHHGMAPRNPFAE